MKQTIRKKEAIKNKNLNPEAIGALCVLANILTICNSFAEIKLRSRDVETLSFVKVIGTGLSLANIDNLQKILQPTCPILDLGMLKHIIEVLYASHSNLNAPLLLFMVCET